jgi:hypothetical protein
MNKKTCQKTALFFDIKCQIPYPLIHVSKTTKKTTYWYLYAFEYHQKTTLKSARFLHILHI